MVLGRHQTGEDAQTSRLDVEVVKSAPEPNAAHLDDAKTAALASLKEVELLFSATAFADIAKRLKDERADDAALTAVREDGLRLVRRFRSYLFKDMRLNLLNQNPFDDGIKTDLVGLHNALGNIELNLLRSVEL